MIKIQIQTDGKKIADSFDYEDVKLNEVALVLYKLEDIKLKLLTEFDFKSEWEFEEEKE